MENTTESVRQNAGYTILQAQTVGNQEIVLGENLNAPDPYVTWICRGGTDYNFGHYCSTMLSASRDFMKRVNRELGYLQDTGALPPSADHRKRDEAER
ncbi:MAG: hypothetical protein ABF449_04130 [Ethanoligenens sp.]